MEMNLPATLLSQYSISLMNYEEKLREISVQMTVQAELKIENKWEEIERSKETLVHCKEDRESGLIYCRGESVVNASVEELEQFLMDVNNMKILNPMLNFSKVMRTISDTVQIIYAVTNRILIVKPREVLALQGIVREKGRSIICCQSIVDDQMAPPQKEVVRANLICGGFILEPKNTYQTKCIHIVSSDPMGQIPNFVKNLGIKQQAQTPNLIRKYFEKRHQHKL